MIQSIVSSSFFKTFSRTQSIKLLLFVCLAVILDVPSMLFQCYILIISCCNYWRYTYFDELRNLKCHQRCYINVQLFVLIERFIDKKFYL